MTRTMGKPKLLLEKYCG